MPQGPDARLILSNPTSVNIYDWSVMMASGTSHRKIGLRLVAGLVVVAAAAFGFWVGDKIENSPTVDPWRAQELLAYADQYQQSSILLAKKELTGSPTTSRFAYEGMAVVGWDDDPLPYLGSGWVAAIFPELDGLAAFQMLGKVWFALCFSLSIVMIYLLLRRFQMDGAILATSIAVLSVALLAVRNLSLPFSSYGFTPELVSASQVPNFLVTHNPWPRVDAFYGLSSTSFTALFAMLTVLGLCGKPMKKSWRFWTLIAPVVVVVLTVGELSRVGTGLLLLPSALFIWHAYRPSNLKKVALFRLFILLGLLPLLRRSALGLIALVRQWQSGIPWDLVPFSTPSGPRLLLGLSFSQEGWDKEGIDGIVWSDTYINERLAKSGAEVFSEEFNRFALKDFFAVILTNPWDYLQQLIGKLLLTAQFFELRLVILSLALIILLAVTRLVPSEGQKIMPTSFGLTMFVLALTPVLASRPFSLFFYYLKPLLDILFGMIFGLITARLASVLKARKMYKMATTEQVTG